METRGRLSLRNILRRLRNGQIAGNHRLPYAAQLGEPLLSSIVALEPSQQAQNYRALMDKNGLSNAFQSFFQRWR